MEATLTSIPGGMRCSTLVRSLAFETGGVALRVSVAASGGGVADVGHGDGAGDCALLV